MTNTVTKKLITLDELKKLGQSRLRTIIRCLGGSIRVGILMKNTNSHLVGQSRAYWLGSIGVKTKSMITLELKVRQYGIFVLRLFLTCLVVLAANYSNANILVVEDFESSIIGNTWLKLNATQIISNCGLASPSNKCLRVEFIPSDIGSPRLVRRIELPKSDHYTLKYDLFFEPGFQFIRGGKLPGLGPDSPTTGCQGISASDWSVRLMWRSNGSVQNYLYGQDRPNPCGNGAVTSHTVFTTGKWHAVEIDVQLNSDKGIYDGHVITRVDSVIVIESKGILLRNSIAEDSLISRFMFSTFFGGVDISWAPSKDVYARFDNFRVQIIE